MPRPIKTGLEFSPQKNAFRIAESRGKDELKKYLRNASSGYIKKPAIRKYIYERDGFTCQICGSKENLQIDHIISVYYATKENIYQINCLKNLRLLCGSCNARRPLNG